MSPQSTSVIRCVITTFGDGSSSFVKLFWCCDSRANETVGAIAVADESIILQVVYVGE